VLCCSIWLSFTLVSIFLVNGVTPQKGFPMASNIVKDISPGSMIGEDRKAPLEGIEWAYRVAGRITGVEILKSEKYKDSYRFAGEFVGIVFGTGEEVVSKAAFFPNTVAKPLFTEASKLQAGQAIDVIFDIGLKAAIRPDSAKDYEYVVRNPKADDEEKKRALLQFELPKGVGLGGKQLVLPTPPQA